MGLCRFSVPLLPDPPFKVPVVEPVHPFLGDAQE
jgi:hypothetical protein